MHVAHIVPIPHLSQIQGNPFHMCLAPIAKHHPEYLNFYKQEAMNGSFIILDNGMFEGDLLRNEEIVELANEIGASEVVAPDHLGDKDKTLNAIKGFSKVAEGLPLMCVPHGKNLKDLQACFQKLYREYYFDTFGFSYMSFKEATGEYRIIYLSSIMNAPFWGTKPNFHILGVAKSLVGIAEIAVLASQKIFRSIDTSLAACVTAHDQLLFNDNKELEDSHLHRPKNFFELELDSDLLETNMEKLEGFTRL